MYLGLRCGFNVALEQGAQGWKHSLNPFRSVPNDAPIFYACWNGNLGLIRELLENGQASVRDRDEAGRTPLHVSP